MCLLGLLSIAEIRSWQLASRGSRVAGESAKVDGREIGRRRACAGNLSPLVDQNKNTCAYRVRKPNPINK
jgi:hypothetical protein